jgi:hypothetical protein
MGDRQASKAGAAQNVVVVMDLGWCADPRLVLVVLVVVPGQPLVAMPNGWAGHPYSLMG